MTPNKTVKNEFYKEMDIKNGGFVGDSVEDTVDNIWNFIQKAIQNAKQEEREEIVKEIRNFRLTSFTTNGQAGVMEREILHHVNEKVDEIAFEVNKLK